jgi:hypothetical protein
MASHSSGSFAPSADDGNQGARGFIARLNTAANAAGLATPAGSYNAATVQNPSPSQWVRATIAFVAGFVPTAATDICQVVRPGSSVSWQFEADVISTVNVQAVDLPAAGTIAAVDTLTASAAVVGDIAVSINVVSG